MPRSVLITGTSSGIGHALAREFKSKGYRVFATARKTESIQNLAELGIETLPLEATSKESIEALKTEISTRTNGSLDILVNNAGRNYTVPALDADMAEIEATFATNLFSVMRMCQTFAPLLIKAKGTIVQIGSIAGIIPYVLGSVCNPTIRRNTNIQPQLILHADNASKAALHSYSDTLRVELAPFDVRVTVVITGGVVSNISRTERTLPEDSIYLPIAEDYERRQVYSQTAGMPNEAYARSVVRQLISSPGKRSIWEGGKSWIVWFISSFLPPQVMDWQMARMFSMWKLRSANVKKLN